MWRFRQMTLSNFFSVKQRFGQNCISAKRRFDEMTFWDNDVAPSNCILVKVYSEHTLLETMCRDWFRRFKIVDFDLSNKDRGKPPKKIKDAELQALLDEDSTETLKKLTKALGVDQGTYFRTLTYRRKDLERRKMGAIQIERKRHWKAKNHLWNFVWSFQK